MTAESPPLVIAGNRRAVAPQSAGRINDRVAMDALLKHGPMTRVQLRSSTGLAQPTTAALVDRLMSRGFVEPAGPAKDGRRGPNALMYQIKRDSAHVAAARINTTEVSVAIADITGEVVARHTRPIAEASRPVVELMQAMGAACEEVRLSLTDMKAVVVGTPGSVDPVTGDVGYVSGHPEWRHGVRQRLEDATMAPVQLENQLNLAGISEYEYGHGQGHNALVLVSVGPGTGMAVVLDGRVWSGVSGGAGEIAYLPVPGVREPRVDSLTQHVTGGYGELVDPRSVHSAGAQVPDSKLQLDDEHTTDIAHRIALGAAAIIAVLDPGLIVLTGDVGRTGGERLAAAVEQQIAMMSPWPTEVRSTSVTGDAVVGGAIATALRTAHATLWGPSVDL